MKRKRQEKILELIETYDIETQDDLTKYLAEAGFSSTQGTVSRDIRELGLTKVAGSNGKQKYAPIRKETPHSSSKYRRVLAEAILGMEDAGNLVVIKTVPGMAMACGAAIDSIHISGVVGCIAGDDTIMCAIKDVSQVGDAMNEIDKFING